MSKSLALVLLSLTACVDFEHGQLPEPDRIDVDDRPGTQLPEPVTPEPEAVTIATDLCDEPTYAGVTWQSHTSPNFTLNYLPGTAAEHDRLVIAARLELAYADIRSQLGITAQPPLTLNLSPNRAAATAHNRGLGRGWPDIGRYDVVYTGAYDSYEVVRYGQLLTLMLNYHLDASSRTRLSLLTTGVAEYLDQSHRNLHDAYAEQLVAGVESRVRVAEFDTKDVNGRNPGRAGSLVQFLVDRYGMTKFVEMYRATSVAWNGSCYYNATHGCISTSDQLTNMIDGVLFAATGEHWTDVQPEWQTEIETALEGEPSRMGPNTTAEIENVVRVMDKAIDMKDAAMYRSTLEGFYCDWGGEDLREDIAARAVNAYGKTKSRVLAIYDTGIKNFSTAQVLVERKDETGTLQFQTLFFERTAGWRVTYGPDWY